MPGSCTSCGYVKSSFQRKILVKSLGVLLLSQSFKRMPWLVLSIVWTFCPQHHENF